MANPVYASQNFSTTLNVSGGIDDSQTSGIVLTSVSGLDTSGGILCIDWASTLDTDVAEYIEYGGISGNTLTGVSRGVESFSAKAHSNGATVVAVLSKAHINRLADKLNGVDTTALQDTNDNELLKTATTASAVNEFTITNAATGNPPILSTTGGDTNINMKLVGKGTGVVKPDGCAIEIVVTNYTTDLSTGDGKAYVTIPTYMNGMNLAVVHARVITAGTTGTTDIQIHNVTDAQDMLSTKITIDSTETASDTAATPAVINTTYDDVATNDLLRIDIDAVSTTAPKGLIVRLEFRNP